MRRILMALTMAVSSVASAQRVGPQTGPDAAGHWEGAIHIPNRDLRVSLDLARNAGGAWIGSMSVLESTSIDVPLTNVVVTDNGVKFAAALPGQTSVEGTVSRDTINGTAESLQGRAPIVLARTGAPAVKLPAPSTALPAAFEGMWEGSLEVGMSQLRLQMKLVPGKDGLATGILISPDQGGAEIPLHTITVSGQELRFDSRSISAQYRGMLSAAGTIDGEFTQGGRTMKLVLARSGSKAP